MSLIGALVWHNQPTSTTVCNVYLYCIEIFANKIFILKLTITTYWMTKACKYAYANTRKDIPAAIFISLEYVCSTATVVLGSGYWYYQLQCMLPYIDSIISLILGLFIVICTCIIVIHHIVFGTATMCTTTYHHTHYHHHYYYYNNISELFFKAQAWQSKQHLQQSSIAIVTVVYNEITIWGMYKNIIFSKNTG